MRELSWALAAIVACGALAAAQDKPSKGCDVKTVEKGKWCEGCKELLEDKDIEKAQHKGKDETHTVVEVDVCVKKYFESACHPEQRSAKPGL